MLKHLLVLLFLPIIFVTGCSVSQKALEENSILPNYSLLYIIHGDANYTYHMDSMRLNADKEALEEAIKVAEKSLNGEVFIFHQKEEKRRFFFFPKKDRVLYHYKGGKLIGKERYSPYGGGLVKEAELFEEKSTEGVKKKFMFYYGHEIPSDPSLVYHQSFPDHIFNTEVFTSDISLFGKSFDLLVLSTCNNGNPLMANKLLGKTSFMIASPRNLHLSYIRSDKVNLIEEDPEISTEAIADSIAKSSFNRLSGRLQTMVTIGVYNLEKIGSYISDHSNRYEGHLKDIEQKTLFRDNVDCNILDVFTEDRLSEQGAYLYYRSPAFGRESGKKSHSVWGCKN
ncbi:hypothetical protein ACKGJO_00420 [Gracilimonas sp. Q87]|uniref:hypothetical protein n=1 Tax=Gracilimonas sp. Q87 TaxID=3384766 RepID=UPI0039842D3C